MADAVNTTLAQVVRPQGRHGELLCELLTDFPEQLTTAKHLSLVADGHQCVDTAVESYWLPKGRSAGRVVIKLQDIETITQAEALCGWKIQMPVAERKELEVGSYFVSDLIGCYVFDGANLLGCITDVQSPLDAKGARLQDAPSLFVVSSVNGGEILIPFAQTFVEQIDIPGKRVVLKLPAGLIELNA